MKMAMKRLGVSEVYYKGAPHMRVVYEYRDKNDIFSKPRTIVKFNNEWMRATRIGNRLKVVEKFYKYNESRFATKEIYKSTSTGLTSIGLKTIYYNNGSYVIRYKKGLYLVSRRRSDGLWQIIRQVANKY
jgi:hypothetical protein